jgi:uncharacterized protein
MTRRLYAWCGVDDPDRFDRASIEVHADAMMALGTASTRTFTTSWELDVGPGWVTRALRVTVRGFGWSRSLDLTRSAETGWRAESEGSGDPDLPPAGLADPVSVAGADDCDLGLCPVTNTMPIRRLGLLDREAPETTLVMAWVEVPSLRVLRSEQIYAASPAVSPGTVRFATADGEFQAEITVDRDGIVVDYPGLARRLPPLS